MIVHDLDLKDEKFGRPERSGVRVVIKGITAGLEDDAQRLARDVPVLDGLYAQFR